MKSASAFCWASAPASVAGVMAPASVNGVTTTAWPWMAISMSPSDIGPSRRSGVFELMIVIRLGRASRPSRSVPVAMQLISMASSTTTRPAPRHCHDLSSSAMRIRYISRCRVGTGRSVGSRGPPPSWWTMSRAPMSRT